MADNAITKLPLAGQLGVSLLVAALIDELEPKSTLQLHFVYKIANCHGCEEYEPVIQATVRAFSPKVKCGRALMHVPGCREIKKRYEFESYPSTHLYKRGKLVFSASEPLSANALANAIREHLIG